MYELLVAGNISNLFLSGHCHFKPLTFFVINHWKLVSTLLLYLNKFLSIYWDFILLLQSFFFPPRAITCIACATAVQDIICTLFLEIFCLNFLFILKCNLRVASWNMSHTIFCTMHSRKMGFYCKNYFPIFHICYCWSNRNTLFKSETLYLSEC